MFNEMAFQMMLVDDEHVDHFSVDFVVVLASHLLKRLNLKVVDDRGISQIDGCVGKTAKKGINNKQSLNSSIQ